MNPETNQNQIIFAWFMSWIESADSKATWIMNWIESLYLKSFVSWVESIHFFESHIESIQKNWIVCMSAVRMKL